MDAHSNILHQKKVEFQHILSQTKTKHMTYGEPNNILTLKEVPEFYRKYRVKQWCFGDVNSSLG